jgi:hypothetical protein
VFSRQRKHKIGEHGFRHCHHAPASIFHGSLTVPRDTTVTKSTVTMSNNPKKKSIDAKMVPFSLRERLHELTGNEFKLWMYLYLRSDKHRDAYPSNDVIMAETGISERNLTRLKQSLRKKGWMTSTQRYRDNGSLSSMNENVTIPAKMAPMDTCQDGTHTPAKVAPISLPELQVSSPPNWHPLEVPTLEVPTTEEPTGEDLSKQAREQVQPSADSAALEPEEQEQNRSGLGNEDQEQEQNQNQNPSGPQTFQELVDSDKFFTKPTELLFKISPNITDAMVQEQLPLCSRILEHFHVPDEFQVLAAEMVLRYNRAHRSGKYASKEDKKLYIRTASQFLKALESDSASLMNDYDGHEFERCEACQQNNVWHYDALIEEIQKERVAKEQARLRAIEEEKRNAEKKAKEVRWSAYEFVRSTPEQKEKLKALRTFDLTALVKSYSGSDGKPKMSAPAVDAAARFFADRNTPFTREEWDFVVMDATEAYRSKLGDYAAVGGAP